MRTEQVVSRLGMGPGQTRVFINNQVVTTDDVDAFALLDAVRADGQRMEKLSSFGLSNSQVHAILAIKYGRPKIT